MKESVLNYVLFLVGSDFFLGKPTSAPCEAGQACSFEDTYFVLMRPQLVPGPQGQPTVFSVTAVVGAVHGRPVSLTAIPSMIIRVESLHKDSVKELEMTLGRAHEAIRAQDRSSQLALDLRTDER